MKKECSICFGVLLLVLFAGLSVSAQVAKITFETKFDFQAGEKVFPAGKYELLIKDDPADLEIRPAGTADPAKKAAIPYLTRLSQGDEKRNDVVFDTAGSDHLLSEIHIQGMDGFYLGMLKVTHSHTVVKHTH